MIELLLDCRHCGQRKSALVTQTPAFALELVELAQKEGMLGVVDEKRRRVLVFCSKEHADAEKTKKGQYRAYLSGDKLKIDRVVDREES